jgi:hypothetical protein
MNHPKSASSALALALTCLLLALAGAHCLAENPWLSSSMGWSSSSFGASRWRSWDATTGGTFSNPFLSSRPSPRSVEPAPAPAPVPSAMKDGSIDPVMLKAASIAEHRVLPHSTLRCWRYVKEALVAAGGVSSYPQTAYACQAGDELVRNYGFVRLPVHSADRAPVGSVLVYGGPGAGHVELRTARGFASDYYCPRPSCLPFIGAYTRIDRHHKDIQTAQIGGGTVSGS